MLRSLRKGTAAWVGTFVAVLAVASFAGPLIAVAFAPTPEAIHCLTQIAPAPQADHDHAGAVQGGHSHDEDHGNKTTKPDHETTCCGMFNVVALAATSGLAPLSFWRDQDSPTSVEPGFYPHSPEQPTRPPNTRLPL